MNLSLINSLTDEIAEEISKEIFKAFSGKNRSFKRHKISKLGDALGMTEIYCDVTQCKTVGKYVDESLLKMSIYPILRTKIHENMHEAIAEMYPEIRSRDLHEFLAEAIPYYWLKKKDPEFAEYWKYTSPYRDALDKFKIEYKEYT